MLIRLMLLFVSISVPSAFANDKPVRMSLGYNNELTIGAHLPTFAYDGREGVSFGTMTAVGNGVAEVVFRSEDTQVPPLLMFPPMSFARVEIYPNDLIGWIDFCSGDAELSFDARFIPKLFHVAMADLTVVTVLTTEISKGSFKVLEGESLNGVGDLNLVGVAEVPLTPDDFVNWLLQLPNDAATDMLAHFDFPEGAYDCPFMPPPSTEKAKLAIGEEGRLKIANWPTFKYDPMGANVEGRINWIAGTTAHVSFPPEDLSIPPLKMLGTKVPGGIGVIINTQKLEGTIDVCSGDANLAFDAVFTPYLFGRIWDTGISVVTDLTTEVSSGYFQEVKGVAFDKWGDGKLAGVALVPVSEDEIINKFLRLPTDAVAKLPAHIDIQGTDSICSH